MSTVLYRQRVGRLEAFRPGRIGSLAGQRGTVYLNLCSKWGGYSSLARGGAMIRRVAVLLVVAVLATVVPGVRSARFVSGALAGIAVLITLVLSSAGDAGRVQAQTNAQTCANLITSTALRADCEVLLGIKDTLRGTAPLNWGDTGVPFAEWTGVLHTGSRVHELSSSSGELNGSIPSSLGNLTGLTHLFLGANQLTGPIPSSLGNLTELQHLYLDSNQLTGPIPRELGNLTDLTQLYLNSNQLTGSIPSSLGNLTELQHLYLDDNQLSGPIPAELGNLTDLTQLTLSYSQLTGPIPAELGNLTGLTTLLLDDNQLSGPIPAELGGLTDLKNLRLGRNQLTGPIPMELGNLTGLKSLHLHHNQLTGPIPAELGGLTGLIQLRLYDNQLTGPIPAELGDLTGLTQLNLQNNQLSGPIPPELGKLTGLTILLLDDNQLSGSIPAELGDLTGLTQLNLQNNQLSGPIPPELGKLTGMQYLYLYDNQLSGSIPMELGNLTGLKSLHLHHNQLTGPIPAELGGLTGLKSLHLHHNQLTGPIPAELGGLTGLIQLRLYDNQLTGPIPAELGQLTGLGNLDLSGNQLSGQVPREIGNITFLRELRLHHNDLDGAIPQEVRGLIGLSLDLEQIPADGMSIQLATNPIYLDLPDEPTPGYADPELTYVSWRYFDRYSEAFAAMNEARLPAGAMLAYEEEREFYQVSLELFDTTGNPIAGARLSEPATICVPGWGVLPASDQRVLELREGSTAWKSLPHPDDDPTVFYDTCGLTRYLGTFVAAAGPATPAGSPSDAEFMFTVEPDGGGFLALLEEQGDVGVFLNVPARSVAEGDQVEFTVRRASKPSPRNFAVSDDPDVVEVTIADGDELLVPVTVCLQAVQDLEGQQVLLRLGDGPAAQWEPLIRVFPPTGYESGWVCGSTRDFSFFTVGISIGSAAPILRIEPSISDVTLSPGDVVRLSFDMYGRQDILNNELGEVYDFEWDNGGAGGGFEATDRANTIIYTAPQSPGRHTVTATSVGVACLIGENQEERCSAKFTITVRRPRAVPEERPAPKNPVGEIPSVLADAEGRQYEVFTPVNGGFFDGEEVTVSAEPGAVPNLEIVGVRADASGSASNVGQTHHRYTLVGDRYDVLAVDATETAISSYVLNSPLEVCVPLPPAARHDISDVAIVADNADGTLTVLAASVRITASSGVNVCGNLSTLPATIAVGVAGAPATLPTAAPEAEPAIPDTGGQEIPPVFAILAMLFGTGAIATAAFILLGMSRTGSSRRR